MAHLPNTALPTLTLSADKKWLHCPDCSTGYWGAFRPTDFVQAKFAAHTERKHKAQEAGAEAPAAALPARKPARGKVAKQEAAAARKGDGAVKIVREAGPRTADLLGDAMADILDDMNGELNPRLQLAQGPREFSDHRDRKPAGNPGRGQDVVARVMAGLSPIKGWA